MSKFKIGDRILSYKGEGTIIDIDDSKFYDNGKDYLVEYDEEIPRGHNGNSVTNVKGKEGHCWWESGECLRLIDRPNESISNSLTKFKIGDRIQHNERGKGCIIDITKGILSGLEYYLVEYDREVTSGHDGNGVTSSGGKDGHCRWEHPEHLKLLEENSSITPKIDKHREICNTLHEIYKAKNHDYGDSFGKSYRKYGLTSAMVRLSDKFNRLESISQKENKVEDETLEDTLIDLANYCIMTLIELGEGD